MVGPKHAIAPPSATGDPARTNLSPYIDSPGASVRQAHVPLMTIGILAPLVQVYGSM